MRRVIARRGCSPCALRTAARLHVHNKTKKSEMWGAHENGREWGRGRGVRRTNEDKLDGGNFGFELPKRCIQFLTRSDFQKPIQHIRYSILKRSTRSLIDRRKPFFQFKSCGYTLRSRYTGTTIYELSGILECAAAGVVE